MVEPWPQVYNAYLPATQYWQAGHRGIKHFLLVHTLTLKL